MVSRLFHRLPAGSARSRLATYFVSNWARADPAAASAWAESLPPGPERDVAVAGAIYGSPESDPTAILAVLDKAGWSVPNQTPTDRAFEKWVSAILRNALVKNDTALLPEILASIADRELRESVVKTARLHTGIDKRPTPEIMTWIGGLPEDVRGEAAADVLRSVRYRNQESALALLDAWADQPAIAEPATRRLIADLLNEENYSYINTFLHEKKRTSSPLFDIAWPVISELKYSPERKAILTRGLNP